MPFAFASIWDTWNNRGDVVTSCAIITTAANKLVAELHDRMPAILLDEFHDAWLNQRTDRTVLTEMLKTFPSVRMQMYPVSITVNHPGNDSAELLVRVDAESGTTPSLF
jgi:putative SOS response-associated peptidase YedK